MEENVMVDELVENVDEVAHDYKNAGIIGLAAAGAVALTVLTVKVAVPWARKQIESIKEKREDKKQGYEYVKAEVLDDEESDK